VVPPKRSRRLPSYSHSVMQKTIVGHTVRTLALSVTVVLVSGGLPRADLGTRREYNHAAVQDPVNITQRDDDDRSYEYADASLVVRWSQLAEDNAVAVDPAHTDPFPTDRGWTMIRTQLRRQR
jgi:hypothetical protein